VVVRWWFCVAGVLGAAACNTYDASTPGQDRDAYPSSSVGGSSGAGVIPATSVGSGGVVDDASGGGGATGWDSGSGGAAEPPDSQPGLDATPSFDAGKDAPVTMADTGPETGTVVDARSEPAPGRDVTVIDAPIPTESLIDDMEDADDAILAVDGRRGAWFVLNDGTPGGVQVPAMGTPFTMTAIPGGRGTSMYAVHTSGHGFTTWSALIGFWVNKLPSAYKQLYDASRWNAITFWAKTSGADASTFSAAVRVQFPDKDTDPDGQVCTADGSLGCSDHFGKTILLTTDWQKYTIRFSSLQQAGFGAPAPSFDAAHLYGVEFQFPLGSTFDCWIDDIAFASLP
jgi:hypothetical protein